jgi:hypothetical protein
MQKRAKTTKEPEMTTPPQESSQEPNQIMVMVEGLLAVLERHEAEPNAGVMSLLTALLQSADRLLEVSTPEETEHNRAALIAMLDHVRSFVETWPQTTPQGWRVH